ncbi:DUF3888 domain-containing protein [Metabacillus litoralis]|uniref:DUF3888 domain-containing protein n=1 Tax=Metabacillus litoralis TaxID=152268 RepID=A0A5C6VL22_9BACI|nr:DUF3888 domain-containing protein [Metabacillus litoralis]TXC85730.1 DUF3888 domain-containing protein [Metabacillus litoralis]
MKKCLVISLMVISLILLSPTNLKAENDEFILPDAFLTTLSPHIDNAVVEHYGGLTQYALYDIEIISIQRMQVGRSFSFTVAIKIFPFEKAHNYIGEDTLTLEIVPSGINVTSYKHQKYK